MKKDSIWFWIILGILIILVIVIFFLIKKQASLTPFKRNTKSDNSEFAINFIKKSNELNHNNNYMVSPYSVEMALSMLREGSSGKLLDDLNSVVPERNIKTLSVKDRVNVANGIFVKTSYKDAIKKEYTETIKTKYDADFIYDNFKTPDKINNWVDKQTKGMIKKVINDIDAEFVLGIANAVAMKEDWETQFNCSSTNKQEFNLVDDKKMDVAMMHNSFSSNAAYYEDDEAEYIILPYKKYDQLTGKASKKEGEQLEFIGMLPKDDINSVVESLNISKLDKIEKNKKYANSSFNINLWLPRFSFSYDFKDFQQSLVELGLGRMFEIGDNFSNMITGEDFYVSEAVHKSYIELDEKGTKAAAVTYFGIEKSAIPAEKETVNIIFNKPFVFMIKDTSSNEILFFGTIYEPDEWDESKNCKDED